MTKAAKCFKSQRPCKVCLNPVKKKTGFQCQGACGQWVHYNCMDATAGKIMDIKSGALRVPCPCPDCKSKRQEFYTNTDNTCINATCPSKLPPLCKNPGCIENLKKKRSEPDFGNPKQVVSKSLSAHNGLEAEEKAKKVVDTLKTDLELVCQAVGQLSDQLNNLCVKLKATTDSNANVKKGKKEKKVKPKKVKPNKKAQDLIDCP